MERRRNIRYLVSKYISIAFPGGTTVIGRARNAGRKGVFVELDMVDPPAHAMVQLLIPVSKRAALGDYLRIPAVITRRTSNGIGLRCTSREGLLLNYART
jgi:hypothetical protein